MTSFGLKEQIRALIAQHFSQIETMMGEAKSKESEALYAGFVANREDQRKSSLEGEISMWQSKKAYGQTAETQMEYAQINAADTMRRKVEAKVKNLEEQQSGLAAFLDSLKNMLSALKDAAKANPLLALFISLVEVLADVVKQLADAEDKRDEFYNKDSQVLSGELNTILESAENKVQNQKELQQSLSSQSIEKEMKAQNENYRFNGKLNDTEKDDLETQKQREFFVDKIFTIAEKLKQEGKELPVENLLSVAKNTDGEGKPKLIIDKSLSVIYEDLTALLGDDNVVINRREDDRRNADDRRGDIHSVNDENRSDIAGRRKGDRRSTETNYFS